MTTALDIITYALRKAGILTMAETPSSYDAQNALATLNNIIDSWSNLSNMIYGLTTENFNLTSGVYSYTIGSGGDFDTTRPIKIRQAFVRNGTTDYNLQIYSKEQYQRLDNKISSTSIPTVLAYNPTYPLGVITFYPIPTSGYTLYLTSEKPLSRFGNTGASVSLPPGGERALVYNLAEELCVDYGVEPKQNLISLARESKAVFELSVAKNNPSIPKNRTLNINNIYTGYGR